MHYWLVVYFAATARVRTFVCTCDTPQAIINLQKTPKDAKAAVVVHAKIDAVMRCVMEELGVSIPVRTARVFCALKDKHLSLFSCMGWV